MVVNDVDRDAVVKEMDDARTTFHHLLDAAGSTGLHRRSNGTKWTNEQLLFHMLFGYLIVRALLILVRVFGRLPAPVSRGFAAVLNFGTTPFNLVNYWGSRFGALAYNHRRMGPKLDRVIESLQGRLRGEHAVDLARSMSYPTRWDPFFAPTMTLAVVYHYPTQHFNFHASNSVGPWAEKQSTSRDVGGDSTTARS